MFSEWVEDAFVLVTEVFAGNALDCGEPWLRASGVLELARLTLNLVASALESSCRTASVMVTPLGIFRLRNSSRAFLPPPPLPEPTLRLLIWPSGHSGVASNFTEQVLLLRS